MSLNNSTNEIGEKFVLELNNPICPPHKNFSSSLMYINMA